MIRVFPVRELKPNEVYYFSTYAILYLEIDIQYNM